MGNGEEYVRQHIVREAEGLAEKLGFSLHAPIAPEKFWRWFDIFVCAGLFGIGTHRRKKHDRNNP